MSATQAGAAVTDAYKKTQAKLRGKGAVETPVKKASRDRSVMVVKKAAEATSEKVVHSLAQLKLTTASALDTIGAQLTGEIATLKEVQEAIIAEREKLQSLYGIVAEADTLQTLILAAEEANETFERERAEAQEERKRELEAESRLDREAQAALKLERKREQEAYDYETTKTRRADADKWAAEQKALREAHDQACAVRTRALDDRDEAIKSQEAELTSLRAMVAKNEETVKAETNKAVAIATNALKRELEHQHVVESLKQSNELSQVRAQLAARDTQITELTKRNIELETRIAQASDKVQQIAEKAIEGASKQGVVVQTGGDGPSHPRGK